MWRKELGKRILDNISAPQDKQNQVSANKCESSGWKDWFSQTASDDLFKVTLKSDDQILI